MFSTRFAVSLVGSHSSPVFGRYLRLRSVVVRKNSSLGENLVLAALFREDPSLVGCCSRFVSGRFLFLWLVVVRKNPSWEKNLFLAACLQENPIFWEKPVFSSGAHRGRSPLLVVYSLPIFGRFLCRKNPFGKKTFELLGETVFCGML